MKMKRTASLLLALLLAVGLLQFQLPKANAVTDTPSQSLLYGRSALAELSKGEALVYAYDRIAEGVEECTGVINVYNGKTYLTPADIVLVMNTYVRDYTGHFWLDKQWSYSFPYGQPDKVLGVSLKYSWTGSELETAKAAFHAAAEEVLSGITPSMSDYEKELYIHDTLAQQIVYMESDHAHDAYGALVEGVAVCEGYAEAYQYLLQQVGIQSFIIEGESTDPGSGNLIGHAWNAVKIGGKFYNVDLTWDDQAGETYHAYFNITNSRLKEDHIIFQESYALPVCNSTDAFYFNGSKAYLETYNTDILAELVEENGGKVHVYVPGDLTEFMNWYKTNWTSVAVQAGFSGSISTRWSHLGHELVIEIFNPCDHSYNYGVTTDPTADAEGTLTGTCTKCGNTTTVDLPKLSKGDYNYKVTKEPTYEETGTATYTWKTKTYGTVTITVTLDKLPVLLGDVDGNGKVNTKDRILLARYLVGWEGVTEEQVNLAAADVNADGNVNTKDRIILTRYIAQWSGYETLPKIG